MKCDKRGFNRYKNILKNLCLILIQMKNCQHSHLKTLIKKFRPKDNMRCDLNESARVINANTTKIIPCNKRKQSLRYTDSDESKI